MDKIKLKVLLITSMPWRDDNNIGNSYSNLFGNLEDVEFAHIYCRDGMPQNKIAKKYFQITEKSLLKGLINPKLKTGKAFFYEDSMTSASESNSNLYNTARILRWEIFFVLRDLIWFAGRWKTKELDEFVEEFNPDLIFGTLTYMPNINNLMVYLKKKFDLPMITYSWDDVYSLKQFSLSPIYWIKRFYQRRAIRKCVKQCEFMYTITDSMQQEYSSYFNKTCKILYKGYDFDETNKPLKSKVNSPLNFTFMGNLGAGRWKTLEKLVLTLNEINKELGTVAQLYIYTLSPKSPAMIKKLSIEGTSYLMDRADNDDVMNIQRGADVLVHVEPTKLSERLFYRLSFSTKVVDYFYNAGCILGIGGKTATLDYLNHHDAGIVEFDMNNLESVLKRLISNPKLINDYSNKAWFCGVVNHQREQIKSILLNDFKSVVKQ